METEQIPDPDRDITTCHSKSLLHYTKVPEILHVTNLLLREDETHDFFLNMVFAQNKVTWPQLWEGRSQ